MKITARERVSERQVSFPCPPGCPTATGDTRKEEKFNFSLPFMGRREEGRGESRPSQRERGRERGCDSF